MAGEERQRHRGQHEEDGAPGGQPGKGGSGAAGAKSRLAAHAAEGGCDIGTLAVLQQYNHNQNGADNHVDQGYQGGNHFS